MINEEDQRIAEAFKHAASRANDTQAEVEFTVGQLLDGDDAVNFLEVLINAGRRVQSGQISDDQGVRAVKEWIVPEEKP